jgi:SAM-dependent methyltransferase
MSHVCITEAPAQAGYEALRDASFRASYDDARDLWSEEPAMQPAVVGLLARLPQAARTLDIGAGRGRDSVRLLAAGHHVDAVDLVRTGDWDTIGVAYPGRACFVEGDFMTAELSGGYDGVLDNGCLHHQHPNAYPAYLQRLHTLTRPGATLVVSFFTPADGRDRGGLWLQHDGRLTKEFTAGEACALVEGCGWHPIVLDVVERASQSFHYLVVTAQRLET